MTFFSAWHPDWRADKAPATKEEHDQSAEKFNLTPEDYRTMPPHMNAGEYPDFPIVGEEQKDLYQSWDDPRMRRNFGEPVCNLFIYAHLATIIDTYVSASEIFGPIDEMTSLG